ncbi:MAG: hypothetical protein KatS3mg112_0247 [Thermogutta sp.]|nr:MAG: hypothetical protein KatS3mg112_0247 [Thermogutta sp.]
MATSGILKAEGSPSVCSCEQAGKPGHQAQESSGTFARKVTGTLVAADRDSSEKVAFRKLSVLIPVYNERWTLAEVVRRVLAAPVSLATEVVIVDDGSTDGSYELALRLAEQDSRIKVIRHRRNMGKGAAIRTAISHLSGDIAIIQDADFEYDPQDFPALLEPILKGQADAVFGSRFIGHRRRVLFFWHTLVNKFLTLVSNLVNDLTLTDMETGYKAIRTDILKQLRLNARTFTIEPELTCRLAQWGARIYEVPVSYCGRTYAEGKKIKAWDGIKALWAILYYRFIDAQFTHNEGFAALRSCQRAAAYSRWIVEQTRPYLGRRILEAGAGIGNLSLFFLHAERLLLVDSDPSYCGILRCRFEGRENVRVVQADMTKAESYYQWREEKLDTVFCSNVLEHLPHDDDVLNRFYQILEEGGHCVIIVPAEPRLFGEIDRAVGHCRRYTACDLLNKMQAAGFQVVFMRQFNRLGAATWFLTSKLLRRRHLNPGSMRWFGRLTPLAKLLDYVLPWSGLSLIVVGRKPQRELLRAAA